MITILATGKLIQDPQHRVSATSKSYCTVLLSTPTDDAYTLVSVIAFDPTCVEKLLRHAKGDAVTVLGLGKLTSWMKNGKEHHGLAITADKVLTPYELNTKRRAIRETEAA